LRPIYRAATEAGYFAPHELAANASSAATRLGARDPFFAFPPEVRRVIYTTNVIESLHMQLRKIIKTRGRFRATRLRRRPCGPRCAT
jgi:transposase-like protein